jgi:hypothetical protein
VSKLREVVVGGCKRFDGTDLTLRNPRSYHGRTWVPVTLQIRVRVGGTVYAGIKTVRVPVYACADAGEPNAESGRENGGEFP